MSEGTLIPVDIFLVQSHVRGYYVQMKVWNDTSNDSLQCKIDDGSPIMALIHDDCSTQKVVHHVTLHLSNNFFHSLELPDSSIAVMIIGK